MNRILLLLLWYFFLPVLANGQVNVCDDLTQNKDFPAFNRELLIDIAGDTIAGYAFIAAGELPKETIILLKGYPGFDNNFDLAQTLRRNGFNVVSFHYRGAWGSQGEYLYSNCLTDVKEVLAFLKLPRVADELRIQKDNFTLAGRSYGGGVALIAGSKMKEVKNIIAISPTNYGNLFKRYQSLDELGAYRRYMQKQVMIDTNIDKFLKELLDDRKVFDVGNYQLQLSQKNLLFVQDSDRNEDWMVKFGHATRIRYDTDHGFIDTRIKMISEIISWLKMASK